MKETVKHDSDTAFIYETCSICREEMEDIEDIWVDLETDNYVCDDCRSRYPLSASKCKDI